MVRYAHIRNKDANDKVGPRGGLTLCYEISNGFVKVAKAQCNFKDNYCRRIGRSITKGRFDKGDVKVLPYDAYNDGKIIDYLLDNV